MNKVMDRLFNKSSKKFYIGVGITLVVMIIAGIILPHILPSPKEQALVNKKDEYQGEPIKGLKESELVEGNYYVRHNDLYYPLTDAVNVNFTERDENGTDCRRIVAMNNDVAKKMPTCYIGNKDKIVFYSENYINDYVDFERFTDAGSSVGIYNMQQNQFNKTYNIPIAEEKDMQNYINKNSDANVLLKDFKANDDNKFQYLTVGTIGKNHKAIKEKMISKSGIIKGLKADKEYTVSIYNGTHRNMYKFSADTHYFTGMEHFTEANTPLGSTTQILEIPSYLPDGYYLIDMGGMVRIVRDKTYKKGHDFNKRILSIKDEIDTENDNQYITSPTDATALYSKSIPDFNLYVATNPGDFGWKDDSKDEKEIKTTTDIEDRTVIDENAEEWKDFLAAYKAKYGEDFDSDAKKQLVDSNTVPFEAFTDTNGTYWCFEDMKIVNDKPVFSVYYKKPQTDDKNTKSESQTDSKKEEEVTRH